MERFFGFVLLAAFVGYTHQQCTLKANPSNPGNYLEIVHGTVMDRACAPGLVFDQVSCTCAYAASSGIPPPVSDFPQWHTASPNTGTSDTDPLLAMLLRELQQPDQTPSSIALSPQQTPAMVPTSIEPAVDHQTLLDFLSSKSRAPAFPSVDSGSHSHRIPQTLSPRISNLLQLDNPSISQSGLPQNLFASPPEKPLVPLGDLLTVQTSTQSPASRSEPQTQPSTIPRKKTSKSKKTPLEMFQEYLRKKGMKVNFPFPLPAANASEKKAGITPSSDSKPVPSISLPSNLPPEVLKLFERSRGPPDLTQTTSEERQSKTTVPAVPVTQPRPVPQAASKPVSRSMETMLLDMLAKVGRGGNGDGILPLTASGDTRTQQLLSSLLGAAGGQERISPTGLSTFSGGLPQIDMMSLLGSIGSGGGDFQSAGSGMVPGGGMGANLGYFMGSSSNLGEGGLSSDPLGVSTSSGLLGLGLTSNTEITNLLNFQGALGAGSPSSMSGLANIDPFTLSHLDRRDIVDVSDLTPLGLAQLGQGLGGLRG
ncbi:hypothetical protein CHS0354_015711 [Potamilus streckersoni]|uniref:Uncharacterized protein n=1 Tax=Potamilus streckersoni TaxID=2493646 RepID=A0AAE0TJU9_9BIVA|nr:hypothetical protein CHS0354_015711 [Potamilus streckersoni]